MRTLIRPHAILTMDARDSVITDGGILVNGPHIERVLSAEDLESLPGNDWQVVNAAGMVALPGFVQTHPPLPDTLQRPCGRRCTAGLAPGADIPP
jgi:cytosine/adenosine deaminase-related metal-dependent hydrolase